MPRPWSVSMLMGRRKNVARLAWLVCVLFAVSGIVISYLNGNLASALREESVDAVTALVFPAVGAIIAARKPGNPMGCIFCFTGLSLRIAIFAAEYGEGTAQPTPRRFVVAPAGGRYSEGVDVRQLP
jgi:hypothetical protein